MVEVFTDGASLGNPGVSGIGVIIYKNEKIIKEISLYIGETTNNFSEYIALIFSLQNLLALKEKGPFIIYMDSELVVNQVKGKYKVKNKSLYPLNILAKNLIALLENVQIIHKRREENKLADSLAKRAAKLKSPELIFKQKQEG
ncbi:MAG: ribonuclease HI family protein [Candidatus Omnitrophica bacterium]|nr:ribonuclease HI family protein [Candidatus Omnitrophota bacterium]